MLRVVGLNGFSAFGSGWFSLGIVIFMVQRTVSNLSESFLYCGVGGRSGSGEGGSGKGGRGLRAEFLCGVNKTDYIPSGG